MNGTYPVFTEIYPNPDPLRAVARIAVEKLRIELQSEFDIVPYTTDEEDDGLYLDTGEWETLGIMEDPLIKIRYSAHLRDPSTAGWRAQKFHKKVEECVRETLETKQNQGPEDECLTAEVRTHSRRTDYLGGPEGSITLGYADE